METRMLTEDAISSCQAIFDASYDDLHKRYGLVEDPVESEWLRPILLHFLETDPEGALIAVEGGEPIAFASSLRRDGYWFLSFLFVLPDAQGRGLGRMLLNELTPVGDDVIRATVVESFQPASTGLYASLGMVPRAFKYWLSGPSRPEVLPRLPQDVRRSELTTADAADVEVLDRRILGFERSADHRWWAEAGTPRWAYRRGKELVAYTYVDDGYVGPALATDEATLCSVVADIVRTSDDPASIAVNVCGDSAKVFQMLIDAGARIDDSVPYRFAYCSDAGPLPSSYIHHSDWLP